MATNFYKKDGSYYTADTNTKIADLNALSALSKAGGKEVSYTPPVINNQAGFGTYAQNRNNGISSATLQAGLSAPNIKESLPSANTQAQLSYAQNTQTDTEKQLADYQKQLNDLKATQLQEAEKQRTQAEADLKTIQTNEQNQVNSYDAQVSPLKDQINAQYKTLVDSISGVDYKSLIESKVSLTNDIISYSKLMKDALDQEASIPAMASISQGRQNAVKENYTSKIASAQAAMSAIDGNFTLAFDILDKGANTITQMTNDHINFLNTVKSFYATDKANAYSKVLNLSEEQKKLIDRAVTDLETRIKNVEANKQEFQKLMDSNPLIVNKAGLLLTDSVAERTKKLNDLYTKSPQYLPENQAFIKKTMDKYYDAGITLNDSMVTVQSKIKNSKIFEKDTAGKFTMTTGINGEPIVFNSSNGDVNVGMRTDRHNNPTAMTTDVAKTLGLVEGVDYVIGDSFPDNPKLFTAKFLGDPIQTTIKALDLSANSSNKQAFYTQSGAPRWVHTAMSDQEWLSLTPEQKNNVIASMYQIEGGSGSLISGNQKNDTVDYWVDLLNKGQATVSNIPKGIVNQVIKRAGESGTSINKPLSDTAIKEIEQTKSALASLDVLEQKVKDNLQYIGPLKGLQQYNPWSKARQVQADVDRVRQTVGKALEGGVLRKEDEEKYKKILATLTDMPETAIYKIQALKDTLNRDIESYKNSQRDAGRYVKSDNGNQMSVDSLRAKYNY